LRSVIFFRLRHNIPHASPKKIILVENKKYIDENIKYGGENKNILVGNNL